MSRWYKKYTERNLDNYGDYHKKSNWTSKIIILIIFILLISYFTNAFDGIKQVKEIKDKIKAEVKDIEWKTPSPISYKTCEQNAREMTPKYWVASDKIEEQEKNYWSDGIIIFKNLDPWTKSRFSLGKCLRQGSEKGENINYYYYTQGEEMEFTCPSISYSSNPIISKEGVVLGTRIFSINNLIFKKTEIDAQWTDIQTEDSYTYSWTGFDDRVKEIFKTDNFNIMVYIKCFCVHPDCKSINPICSKNFTEEEGTFNCDFNEKIDLVKDIKYCKESNFGGIYIKISPEVFDNVIYELISYDVESCKWVEE